MPGIEGLSAALMDRYRIERELGAGGMATVYLAHDVRHDRKVALKVLRPELAAILGGERFLAEIKTTANLQHPHILSLFDSGEADGLVYYVMPYVEGESLRDRLAREKQLPVEDAVRIACEVADALEYAHQHGIVHRDIKPENILLHGGHAMVADFGIALAASRSDGGTRMTETGMSLGTPHYMSPEQSMGEREITPKADIYALGCVLYEMLTAEPPFTGATAQAIIARVMTEQPRSLTVQRHTIPSHLEAVVIRALEKLPADRFASAAAFNEALKNPAGYALTVTGSRVAASGPARHDWRSRVALPALGAVAVLALLLAWVIFRPRAPLPVARYALALPSAQAPLLNRQIAVSPDGSYIAYLGSSSSGTYVPQLWLKARGRDQASPVPGTIGVESVTFSPDGEWLAYGTETGELKKLQIGGGAAIKLADSMEGRIAAAWLDDGTIVYATALGRGLRRIPQGGGAATWAWRADSFFLREVTPLPGARAVLLSRCAAGSCLTRDIWSLDLKSGRGHRIVAGGLAARYLPGGHLLFVRDDGAALVMPFDLGSADVRGSPVTVFDSVAINANSVAEFDISRTGTLAMINDAGGQNVLHNLVWVDRAGRESAIDLGGPVHLTSQGNAGWALSPDGRKLAISLESGAGAAVWVKELPSGPLQRVTLDSAIAFRPRWLPGGRELSYIAGTANDGLMLRRVTADGTGRPEVLKRDPRGFYEGAVSPDGRWIVARTSGGIGRQGRDIIGFRAGDTTAVPLMADPSFDESAFAISPDGRWIAYESDESGRREVYVRPFPATNGGKWQASTAGGMAPLWARNGRELFFVDRTHRMTAVAVAGGSEPHFGERRPLFALSPDDYLDDNTYYTPFDVGPDGRFVMARQVRSANDVAPLIVVENWFTELKQRLRQR
ncbi:MAG: protein kinase [Gemmatimonadales bacterium]